MDSPRRVTLRVDQNGAEELTPPGQAILVRGAETLTVMTPYWPDDERAQRLARLRGGEVELTDDAAALQDQIAANCSAAALQRCNETNLLA